MNKFVILYWIGAVFLVISSYLYQTSKIGLIPFGILAILGADAMLTAVIDYHIRERVSKRGFKHILVSEIAFWIGLLVTFFAFFSDKRLIMLGIVIMLLSVFEFLVTQKRENKTPKNKLNITEALLKEVLSKSAKKEHKKKSYLKITPHKLYQVIWFLSIILIISAIVQNKWVTAFVGLAVMILCTLGYKITKFGTLKTEDTVKSKELAALYSIMWLASIALIVTAFIYERITIVVIGLLLIILSTIGYKATAVIEKKERSIFNIIFVKDHHPRIEFMFILAVIILALGFSLYVLKFVDLTALSVIELVGLITLIIPLLSFKRWKVKEKKIILKRITPEETRKKELRMMSLFYVIGSILVIAGFLLFNFKKIDFNVLAVISIVGLAIVVITNLYMHSRHKRNAAKEKLPSKEDSAVKLKKYHLRGNQSVSETVLDELVELVNDLGVVRIKDLAAKFGVKEETVEEWAKILEQKKLVMIYYPAFGGAELRKWKK
ncbi:MAG: hypothetical protein HYS32_03860 [Candidatus Woesearchaeota archaeon]|nr:MAG: hypothetical protein HYS32_03860 [Candidatus Woesearchaeota archaeon]